MNPESSPLALFQVVRRGHTLNAWRDINPMYAETLRLAITSGMVFQEEDFARIDRENDGGFWMGPDPEVWYALACKSGHPTCVLSVEKWMKRTPFMLDGERIYVGRLIQWEGMAWRCTSIEADFVRVKCEGMVQDEAGKWVAAPATVKSIPREGLEAKIASDKAHEKAERAAQREANRPDPVALLPLDGHFEQECGRHGPRGIYTYIPRDMIEWAKSYGTDYKRAWVECDSAYWLGEWLVWIGLYTKNPPYDIGTIRKRHSWPKVEAQIFRFVRKCRKLPMKDAVLEAAKAGA